MATFSIGDAVIVAGHGPGVVTYIVGGPAGHLYHVTLTDGESQGYGFSSRYSANEVELTAASDIPVYAPGDVVLYQNRNATVVAVDPVNGAVEVIVEPPLPDPDIEVDIECRVVLPRWKVYLQQVKG